MIRTVQCTSCSTSFPVDPRKVPDDGVYARCSECDGVFFVEAGPAPHVASSITPGPETPAVAEPDSSEPTPEPDAPDALEDVAAEAPAIAVPEAPEATTPEAPDVVEALETEPAEPEPPKPEFDAADLEDEPPADEAASSLDSPDDWVFETEPDIDPATLDVTPVDTVEGDLRQAQDATPSFDGLSTDTDLAPPPPAELDTVPESVTSPEFDAIPEPAAPPEPEPPVAEAPPPATPAAPESPAEPVAPPEPSTVDASPQPPAAPEPPATPAAPKSFTFGKRDPHEKASRLARVLVSDIITYNPDRHQRALDGGTLKDDFDDEIKKSWGEYIDQVGKDLAESTNYFNDALNEILARGQQVF